MGEGLPLRLSRSFFCGLSGKMGGIIKVEAGMVLHLTDSRIAEVLSASFTIVNGQSRQQLEHPLE